LDRTANGLLNQGTLTEREGSLQLSFEPLPFDQLSFEQLSFEQLSFDQLSFDQLPFAGSHDIFITFFNVFYLFLFPECKDLILQCLRIDPGVNFHNLFFFVTDVEAK
jgi:hypothetical protein